MTDSWRCEACGQEHGSACDLAIAFDELSGVNSHLRSELAATRSDLVEAKRVVGNYLDHLKGPDHQENVPCGPFIKMTDWFLARTNEKKEGP